MDQSILWRRLDRAGHECARLIQSSAGWKLRGTAVFEHEKQPCNLDYLIECDAEWKTVATRVIGWLGNRSIYVDIKVDPTGGGWTMNRVPQAQVHGCIDVDLNFSPSTNLLPVRRLSLGVGNSASVHAAWLRFPSFVLERLDQRYQRLDQQLYRYESAGGSFVADLEINSNGFVTRYPGFCEAVAIS
jgi:uncharacterized protein